MNKKIMKWLREVTHAEPALFYEYFYADIAEYLNADSDIELEESMQNIDKQILMKLERSKSKEDVVLWVNDICHYVFMHLETQELIHEYISKKVTK